jgi:hypothetical protein
MEQVVRTDDEDYNQGCTVSMSGYKVVLIDVLVLHITSTNQPGPSATINRRKEFTHVWIQLGRDENTQRGRQKNEREGNRRPRISEEGDRRPDRPGLLCI